MTPTKADLLERAHALGIDPPEDTTNDRLIELITEVEERQQDDGSDAGDRGPGVATAEENAELEHTRGGATTRDAMDAGVSMQPGDPAEPIGPEDALGPGPKRGDYADRLIVGPPMTTRVIPEAERRAKAEELVEASDNGDGPSLTVDQALGDVPRTELVSQVDRADERGDAPGKGGVPGTAPREGVA